MRDFARIHNISGFKHTWKFDNTLDFLTEHINANSAKNWTRKGSLQQPPPPSFPPPTS